MTPERWQQIREVFDRALSLHSEERAAYIATICANDSDLRREVESLLFSDDQAGTGFLKSPVVDLTHPGPSPFANRVGRRIGAYNILEEIGRGAWVRCIALSRADGQYDKQVAIKFVRARTRHDLNS